MNKLLVTRHPIELFIELFSRNTANGDNKAWTNMASFSCNSGGGSGIRTHDRVAPITVFKLSQHSPHEVITTHSRSMLYSYLNGINLLWAFTCFLWVAMGIEFN